MKRPLSNLLKGFVLVFILMLSAAPFLGADPVNPDGLVYTPDNAFLDKDGLLYLFSKSNKSIFRWNPVSQSYQTTICLLEEPKFVAYSKDNHSIYLAYNSGSINQIDLALGADNEVPFVSLPMSPLGLSTAGSFVFACDQSGAWNTHYTFDVSGNMIDSVDWNYYSTEYIWNDANQKMYFFRDDTSPNDLLWEEINADGVTYAPEVAGAIGAKMDSPLHDSTGFNHPIRVASDGSIVVLGSGAIHDAVTLERSASALSNSITDATWLNSVLMTARTNSGAAQYQKWNGSYTVDVAKQYQQEDVFRLFPLDSATLVAITIRPSGIPDLYLLDGNLDCVNRQKTLTYIAGANGSITGTSPQTISYGTDGTAVTAVADANYHFVDWSDGSTANPRTDTNVIDNLTVTANFVIDTYTATYNAGANGSISGTSPQTIDYGSDSSPVSAVPNVGYHFVDWSDGSNANPRSDTITEDLTVTANFAINPTYTLTVNNGTGGGPVVEGLTAAITADAPAVGYHFENWATSDGGFFANAYASTTNYTMPGNDATVTASYHITSYNVTYYAGVGGSIMGFAYQCIEHGSDATSVTATPNPGYHFVDWSDGVTTATRTDTNIAAALTVTANFTVNPTYTLTVINGAGAGTYPEGSINAISADVPTGYHFINWTTSDGGVFADASSSSTVYTMPGNDATVTANIAENLLTVTIDKASISENGGTATGTVTRNTGTSGSLFVMLFRNDFTEVTLSGAAFIPNGSDIANFTITGVDDAELDGTQQVTITARATNYIDGTASIYVTDDDDTAGFTVSPDTLSINEDGSAGTFDVTLNTQPASDVVLNITNSSPGNATIDKTTLTFTNTNWGVPQTVTVTPIDDSVNGNDTATLTVSVDGAISDDAYDSVAGQNVTVTCQDDDPTAVDDIANVTALFNTIVIDVLANDSDPQNDNLTITGINYSSMSGNVSVTDAGKTITYQAGGVYGTYSLTYYISDGNGGTSEATLKIVVGKIVTYGLCFKINATEVEDGQGGNLVTFIRKPRVTAKYIDPNSNREMAAVLFVPTQVPYLGRYWVNEVECEWKRNVCLYDKRNLLLANSNGQFTSSWLATNPIKNLVCDIRVQTYRHDFLKVDDILDKKLVLSAPEITDFEKWDGTALGTDPLQTEGIVVIKGKYFGCRPPTVWLEYLDSRGRIRKQRLTVERIYEYDDSKERDNKSCMDVNTGDSQIRVKMPKRWWRDWTAGAYDLVIDNRVGLATTSVTTSDDSVNTVPTLAADSFDIKTGERTYQLDVLANDSDTQSDSVKIEFASTTTAQGGRVAYDRSTGQVKYTPPRGAEELAPFTDTFQYTLDDGHSDEINWPANVTATINVTNP